MLTIKRPTPTTVLYTVSTRSPANNLSALASTYLLHLIRLLAATLVLLTLLVDYTTYLPALTPAFHTILPASTPLTTLVPHPLYRLAICAAILALVLRKGYAEESLLVVQGLGVQTSTSSSSFLWSGSTRFIPTSEVQDVFIHEAFRGFEVRFYLSVVVEGEEGVVVVFPVSCVLVTGFARGSLGCEADLHVQNILPRREILEEVWRGVRAGLYEPKA